MTLLPSECDSPPAPLFPYLLGLSLRKVWAGPSFSSFVYTSSLPNLKALYIDGLGGENTAVLSVPAFTDLESLRLGRHECELLRMGALDLSSMTSLVELHISSSDAARVLLESVPTVLDRIREGPGSISQGIACPGIGDSTIITTWFLEGSAVVRQGTLRKADAGGVAEQEEVPSSAVEDMKHSCRSLVENPPLN